MEYFEFRKALQAIGEAEKTGEYWKLKELTFAKLENLHEARRSVYSDNGNFISIDYYYLIELAILDVTKLPNIFKSVIIKALLQKIEKTSWNDAPVNELLKAELSEIVTQGIRKPTTPPPAIMHDTDKITRANYTREQLEKIFDKLAARSIVIADDKSKFVSIFTDNPKGKVYWNLSIEGAHRGLFYLMQKLTGEAMTASNLKKIFTTEKPIQDGYKPKDKQKPKMITEILKDV